MKKIICPSCGSTEISILENDKIKCKYCDTIFYIHDYSKEFEQASQRIDGVQHEIDKVQRGQNELRQELKDIKQNQKQNVSLEDLDLERYNRLIDKAVTYYNDLDDVKKAIASATEASDLMPELSQAYIILYQIWTNAYSDTKSYEIMLNTRKTDKGSKIADTMKKALKCSDCPASFEKEVTKFLGKCIDCAIQETKQEYILSKKKSEADTEAINNKLNTALSEESNKTSKLMRAKRRSYFLRILFPTILLLPCFIPFFSGLYSIIALLGGIVYILFSFIKKLIKREIDDLGRTLIITSLLIFLSLFAYCCLIDNFSFILDIVFWAITIFLLCRPVKRKYIDKLLVLNSDKTVSKLQSSLKDKQETANIEQTRLIKKLGLYTEMQFDAEKDDGGATLIKNYLNSKYLQKS